MNVEYCRDVRAASEAVFYTPRRWTASSGNQVSQEMSEGHLVQAEEDPARPELPPQKLKVSEQREPFLLSCSLPTWWCTGWSWHGTTAISFNITIAMGRIPLEKARRSKMRDQALPKCV